MHSLPIPTQDQIRAAYAAIQTDILNAYRRCAPQAELNALHDQQAAHLQAVNSIACAKECRHKARALLAQSDAPGYEAERYGLRYEAQRQYELAERALHNAYRLLGLTGSPAQDEANRKWNEAAARENKRD